VALAARSNSLIVVENVREDPNWLPNDLLPETRSEMAVPITLEGRVEGVLDVQSEQVGGLTGDASLIIQSLADQVAIAIRNARLFSQTEQALRQAQQLQNFYTHQAWEKFGQVQKTTDYEVRQSENLPSLAQISTPEAILAVQERQTVNLRLPTARSGSQVTNGGNGDAQQGGSHNVIATPLKIGDQVIGVLGVQDENERRQWSEDEIALIEAVSEQMSLALENARLFSESRQQAAREEIIANLTQAIWAGDDLQTVLRNTVSNLGETLKASKVVLRLHAEQDND
jgi:GAF domain-containing protein